MELERQKNSRNIANSIKEVLVLCGIDFFDFYRNKKKVCHNMSVRRFWRVSRRKVILYPLPISVSLVSRATAELGFMKVHVPMIKNIPKK